MKINYSFGNHFVKKLPVYITSAIICSSILSLLVSFKTRLKDRQVFDMFISSPSLSVNTSKIKETFSAYFDEEILSFNVHAFDPNLVDYPSFFNTLATQSDLVILSEDSLNMVDSIGFIELPSIYQKETNYVLNNKQIGYKVYDGEHGYLTNLIDYGDKNFYVFVNSKSVHTLNFSNSGETSIISSIFRGLLSNEEAS